MSQEALHNFVKHLVQKAFGAKQEDEKPKRCPVCQDGACETKSDRCGK